MITRLVKSKLFFRWGLALIGVGVLPLAQAQTATDSLSQVFMQQFAEEVKSLADYRSYMPVKNSATSGESANYSSFCADELTDSIFGQALPFAREFYHLLENLPGTAKEDLEKSFARYEPYFSAELKVYDLPQAIKYLAPALSGMNTLAVGKNSRAGIWQLQHFQGIVNGLQINELIDERLNVAYSTKAAFQQIQKNKLTFGSTDLAILAYLSGNVFLKNTLARLGRNAGVSELLASMPLQVQHTIAAYQALSVFLSNKRFESMGKGEETQCLTFSRQVHFKQIAQVMNVSEKELQVCNPQYKYGIVPGDLNKMTVRVRVEKETDILALQEAVYGAYDSSYFQVVAQKIEYPPAPNRQYVGEKVKDLEIEGKTKLKYTIKSGDVLGFIAEDFDVRVADLKYWNNIYNERRIQAGKQLIIFVDDDKVELYAKTNKVSQSSVSVKTSTPQPTYQVSASAKKVEHTVKSGESPYVIAKKYGGVTPEAILFWNGINDARKIQIGQKLIIYLE